MDTNTGTVTVWQSGRLAPHVALQRFEFSREQWLVAALWLLAAVMFTLYVAVLERDVGRGELQHEAQRSRAVAEAQCESDQPAELRGRCIALFNGDEVAVAPAPDAAAVYASDETASEENAARAATVSLLATAR